MRVIPVGWGAVLVECDREDDVDTWRAALWRDRSAGRLTATEIVPGAGTVLIDGVPDPEGLAARLRRRPPTGHSTGGDDAPPTHPDRSPSRGPTAAGGPSTRGGQPPHPADLTTGGGRPPQPAEPPIGGDRPAVEIPTWYDGPDLATVARHWRMTVEEVVATHLATEFRVAFCGFAPGFGYLTGLPERLTVPRLASPRPRVPAGSVALADRYSGIYPSESPGGWLLIGRTDVRLFDVAADPPALLVPGARVRFVPAGRGSW